MSLISEKFSDKRVFVSDGVEPGTAALVAECGRVMAIVDLDDLPDDLLALTDTVCLNYADAGGIEGARRR